MNQKRVMQRLYTLRKLELLNIFLLPAVLALNLYGVANWQPYAYNMAIVCIILGQGTLYWHLKIIALEKGSRQFPPWFYPLFRTFWWLNAVLLLGYLLYITRQYASGTGAETFTIWSHLLWLFALLEQINYYHYQLSHDNWEDLRYLHQFKKLRKSPLRTDLERQARRRTNLK